MLKKAIIKLGRKMCFESPQTIYKVNNGYIFADNFYSDVDSLAVDFIKETKKYFGED